MSNQSGWWRRLTWFLTAASPMKIQRTNAKFSPVISKPVTAVISYNLMALFHKIGHEMPTTAPNLFAFGNAKSFAFRGGIIVRHACGFAAFHRGAPKATTTTRAESSRGRVNCFVKLLDLYRLILEPKMTSHIPPNSHKNSCNLQFSMPTYIIPCAVINAP